MTHVSCYLHVVWLRPPKSVNYFDIQFADESSLWGCAGPLQSADGVGSPSEFPLESFETSKAIIANTVITGDVGQAGGDLLFILLLNQSSIFWIDSFNCRRVMIRLVALQSAYVLHVWAIPRCMCSQGAQALRIRFHWTLPQSQTLDGPLLMRIVNVIGK